MSRCYNFCAGPAALPEAVLETARDEMLEWHDRGLSVMEMSHRSPEFVGVAQHAEATLRQLLGISEDYAVLFLQGGASSQFAGDATSDRISGTGIMKSTDQSCFPGCPPSALKGTFNVWNRTAHKTRQPATPPAMMPIQTASDVYMVPSFPDPIVTS